MARVAFVQNLSFEYLGVMYLSSFLKKNGHEVEMFIVTGNGGKSIEEIAAFRPDIAGFSCTTGVHRWALDFAARIKQKLNCKVVFGGPHATYFPEVINETQVDIVIRGEGEHALLDVAESIDSGSDSMDHPNCWFKKNGSVIKNVQRHLIENLDDMPFPDRDLYYKKYPFLKKSQYSFIGGRGCPFDCTFCFNHAFNKLHKGKGKVVRSRSVDHLIAEIKEVKRLGNMKTVYMMDDVFTINKKWIKEFTKAYTESNINLPYICLIRADLDDEDTIRMLSESGCKNVFFGIESGSEEMRNILLKKRVTDMQIKNTAVLLKKYGIRFRTYNILGLPGETLEDAFKTVKINSEIGTNYPWCSVYYPFPGTELAAIAQEKGLVEAPEDKDSPSFFKDSVIQSKNRVELANLQKLFFYCVKFPALTPLFKRLIRFRQNLLFDIAFLASYSWCYIFSENLTLREIFSIGYRNIKVFFFSRTDK